MLKTATDKHFLEHGLAPDERVQRWQRRLNPLLQRFFGGCQLTRPTTNLLTAWGFVITEVETFHQKPGRPGPVPVNPRQRGHDGRGHLRPNPRSPRRCAPARRGRKSASNPHGLFGVDHSTPPARHQARRPAHPSPSRNGEQP
jgi:hypothetical protein